MKLRWNWFITLFLLCHPQLHAQAVTSQLPLEPTAAAGLPDDPAQDSTLPQAHVVAQPPQGTPVHYTAQDQVTHSLPHGNEVVLTGQAVFYYRDYIVHADKVTYNDGTGDVIAEGHLMVDGGPDDEHIEADHGSINVYNDTADYFEVVGSLGVRRATRNRMIYTTTNPFIITGREMQQLGRGHYRVLHGTMTACRLPRPDWQFFAKEIELNNGQAKASNSMFGLLGIPLFYVPYVKHEVGEQRGSGLLLPVFGTNSTKGTVLGEAVYFTLGRSADMLLGSQYYSKRGFAPYGMFRYKGQGDSFALFRFVSLLDRLPGTENEGGVDVNLHGRYDFSPNTRAVVDAEYLSSYVYRLTFEENYAVAINSEVQSQAFLMHEKDGYSEALRMNRYQNFQNYTPSGDEVRILHLPEADLDGDDHPIEGTPLMWGYSASAAALSRYDYNPYGADFRTGAEIPRIDVHPRVAMPLHLDGWNFRPEVAVRDTAYGKSQLSATLNQFPTMTGAALNRFDFEGSFDLRPPAMGRDFSAPWLTRLLGGELRHTIEPDVQYRYVTGVNNFRRVLRFDDVDVASDTNEVEYGLTQRLYLRHLHPHPCKGDEALGPNDECGGGTLDWLSWTVAQKYYMEPTFNHAVTPGTPNSLLSTLDLTGVDFLTRPRYYSPIISRLRMRTLTGTDAEWDLDYDTKTGRITSSNVFTSYTHGNYHLQFGDSYLDTLIGYPPGTPAAVSGATNASTTNPAAPTPYNQINATAVFGSETRTGLNAGATTGYDIVHGAIQYGAVQAVYNWNCCGLSLEWRRFSLANIRNDTEYMYSFTLAGFGSTGIPRGARVF